MFKLVVDFQDGFHGDAIELRLNGTHVFHETAATTNPMLGLATSFDTALSAQQVHLEVIVLTRNLAEGFVIEVQSDTFVGINIESNNLSYQLSHEPFWYA